MYLGPLYHWSPRDRRKAIKRQGLMPGKRNMHGPRYHGSPDDTNEANVDIGTGEFRQDGVCFSTDPDTAWRYSHAVWKSEGTFDLWMVYPASGDNVHVVPMWGGRVVEVRIKNRIPKSRLIWVGQRSA